jgi:hypothetical protein
LFNPENFPATHYEEGWVDPREVGMAVEERKKSLAKREFEPRTPRSVTVFL